MNNIKLRKFISEVISEALNESLSLIRGVGKNETGNVDLFGKGLYLTDNIDVAKFYGDTIKEYSISGKVFDTTKDFDSSELRKFFIALDSVLNTNIGAKYLKQIIDYNEGEFSQNTNVDYIGISWALDSMQEFQEVLKKNNLLTNDFNSYANVCTAMNLALQKMGYVGLKYSTSEIEDLDDRGLGNRNAYLIFNNSSIKNSPNQNLNEEYTTKNNINNNFKRWFDNSIMVENGNPIIFYHGSTDNKLNKFKEKSFRYNGIYLTRKINYAKKFGSNILSLYVSMKNPYIIDMEETNFGARGGFIVDDRLFPTYRDMSIDEINFLKSKGYDGVLVNVPKNIVKTEYGDEEIYNGFELVVFNPNNVKSIDNDGSWDVDDDNVFS